MKTLTALLAALALLGCASTTMIDGREVSASGDSMASIETCESVEETLDAAGNVVARTKSGCETIHVEGGHASEGFLATTLQGLSIIVGLVSIFGGI